MQYPIYYKRKDYPEYIMFDSENVAVKMLMYEGINGVTITKHEYFDTSDLQPFIDDGHTIAKSEFLNVLAEALLQVKFTAHGCGDAIETIKQSLSKVG